MAKKFHPSAGRQYVTSRVFFCVSAIVCGILFSLSQASAAETKPVWVVSNGFHSALVFRAQDVPFRAEISSDLKADVLLIGWGAAAFYQGKVNVWTVVEAFFPNDSVLHVIPIRGSVRNRFSHSDVIRLSLSNAQFRILMNQVGDAFTKNKRGRPEYLAHGFCPAGRFYKGSERFYMPRMCNVWVAQKLRNSGVKISVVQSFGPCDLMRLLEKSGKREQWRKRPVDVF